MLDHRFDGEKNLANKLEGFDYGTTVGDLPTFDSMDNQSSKKSVLWPIIKILSILSVLGGLVFFLVFDNKVDLLSYEQQNEVINSVNDNVQGVVDMKVQDVKEFKNHQQEASTSLDIENGSSETSTSQIDQKVSNTTSSVLNSKSLSLNKNQGGTTERNNVKYGSHELNIPSAGQVKEKVIGYNSENEASRSGYTSPKEEEAKDINYNRTLENCMALYSSIPFLEIERILFDDLLVETEPIKVEKNSRRNWISFGVQYNTGNTHPGAHETPFVSSFETTIDGGKSYGYGFFGHINLNSKNTLRPSFTYSKNTHLQFINGLVFQTGPTGINMELYSHELKFGLDYAFNFLPSFELFDIKAGVGLSYHNMINLESNNYYTEAPEIVKNANELDLSPLSYKLFFAVEVPVYKNIVFGLEPYVIYQKRRARFTPSTFLADQGDYNLISGLNLTMRF